MRNAFDVVSRQGDDRWKSNPPFERRHLRAIELALRKAWDELHSDHVLAAKLSTSGEVEISHLLRDRLNQIRERETGGVPGYDCDTFYPSPLGGEMQTPQGKIRKPDIAFGLCGRLRPGVSSGLHDCIFVECKLIDQTKNARLYCKDGLQRFVTDAYAAWMREGMMLAYVRAEQVLPDTLEKATRQADMQVLLASNGQLKKCTLSKVDPRVYISIHDRDWSYPDGSGRPGPIEVRHLWLRV